MDAHGRSWTVTEGCSHREHERADNEEDLARVREAAVGEKALGEGWQQRGRAAEETCLSDETCGTQMSTHRARRGHSGDAQAALGEMTTRLGEMAIRLGGSPSLGCSR